MYPRIYNSSNDLLAVLDNIIKDSAKVKHVVNGEFTFAFSAYEKELKSVYFDTDNYILLNGQTFDIKYLEQKHEVDVIYAIQCEHAIYRLEDGIANQYVSYAYTGTPAATLADILSGTEFSVGTVDFTDPIAISINSAMSKKALITYIANLLGGELEFTDNGFTVNILATIGNDNGFQVRFGKNLKSITKIIDKRGELKVHYTIDMIALKNTNAYIEKGLQTLEVVEIGDTIKVIDSVIGIDIENRILSIEYDPILEVNTKLEIVNTLELITDHITSIETRSVIKEELYNGVYIGPNEGIVAERSDNKVKTVMSATEGISLYTDEGAGYIRNFYVDPSGRIQAKALDISGDSTFGGRLQIFDGVNAQVDIFEDTSGGYAIFYNNSGDRIIQIGSDPAFQQGLVLVYNGDGSPSLNDDIRSELSIHPTDDVGQVILSRANRDEMLRVSANAKGGYFTVDDESDDLMIYLGNDSSLSANNYGYLLLLQAYKTKWALFNGRFGGFININDPSGTTEVLLRASGTSYFDNGAVAINTTLALGYELFVEGDQKVNAGSIVVERDTSGGFLFVNNDNGYKACQFGLNSAYSYIPGSMLLFNGASTEDIRVSLGVNSTGDYGFLNIYNGANINTAVGNNSGDAVLAMYNASGTQRNRLEADGNNYLNDKLSVGNISFFTNYSINAELGIRCPFIRLVEGTSDPTPTTDGTMFVTTNKLYVYLGGSKREVALV